MSPLTSCFQHHTRRLANPMRKGNKNIHIWEEEIKLLCRRLEKNPGTNKQYTKVAGYKIQLFPLNISNDGI